MKPTMSILIATGKTKKVISRKENAFPRMIISSGDKETTYKMKNNEIPRTGPMINKVRTTS